jgi:hypothetical protein
MHRRDPFFKTTPVTSPGDRLLLQTVWTEEKKKKSKKIPNTNFERVALCRRALARRNSKPARRYLSQRNKFHHAQRLGHRFTENALI